MSLLDMQYLVGMQLVLQNLTGNKSPQDKLRVVPFLLQCQLHKNTLLDMVFRYQS